MQNTANYALPTWEQDDQIKMSDFNALTAKLDAALKSNADAAAAKADASAVSAEQSARQSADSALQAALAAVKTTADAAYSPAQPPFAVGSYTGNGGTQSITLGFKPRFLLLSRGLDEGDYTGSHAVWLGCEDSLANDSRPVSLVLTFTDDGFTVKTSAYSSGTLPALWLNTSGKVYSYVAFR